MIINHWKNSLNMAEFCKQFNERTEPMYEKDIPLTVKLSALSDRSFTFQVHSPPTAYLIRRSLGIHNEKCPSNPNIENPSGSIAPEAVYEIAKLKQQDGMRWHLPLEGIARSVEGTARSMGIQVREATEE
jgi:large subunit ribosomal protein L11